MYHFSSVCITLLRLLLCPLTLELHGLPLTLLQVQYSTVRLSAQSRSRSGHFQTLETSTTAVLWRLAWLCPTHTRDPNLPQHLPVEHQLFLQAMHPSKITLLKAILSVGRSTTDLWESAAHSPPLSTEH